MIASDSQISLEELLQVEDDPLLLEFVCPETGSQLWPELRNSFLRCVLSDMLYAGAPVGAYVGQRRAMRQAIGIARSVWHNWRTRNARSGSILLVASGAGLSLRDGRWFNRLSDYFAMAIPRESTVLEDHSEWRWPHPRHNRRVLYHAPVRAVASAIGHVARRDSHSRLASSLVEHVAARARRLLSFELGEGRRVGLENGLARLIAHIPARRRMYQKLLSRLGVRLALKEDGCFGYSAVFNMAARELGVTVAEYQHGAISAGHDAYNFAPVMLESREFRNTLPDYFLAYGQWWMKQINAPVERVAIGNPHRDHQIAQLHSGPGRGEAILVLGDGIETESYLSMCGQLASRLNPRREVVFRPHPNERARMPAMRGELGANNVRLDEGQDIYASFQNAYAVVSELSTGMFEAVGLVEKVFMWDTRKARFGFPAHPFDTFRNVDELVDKLLSAGSGAAQPVDPSAIWEPCWRKNYEKFALPYIAGEDR